MKMEQVFLIVCIVLAVCVAELPRMPVTNAFCEEPPVLEELRHMNTSDRLKLRSWDPLSPSAKDLNRARLVNMMPSIRHFSYATGTRKLERRSDWTTSGTKPGER